jgi:hypothetical protein
MRSNIAKIILSRLYLFLTCLVVSLPNLVSAPSLVHAGGANASGAAHAGVHHAAQHSRASAPASNPVKSSPVTLHPSALPDAAPQTPAAHGMGASHQSMGAAHHTATPTVTQYSSTERKMYRENGMSRADRNGAYNSTYGYYQPAGYAYSNAPARYRNEPVVVPVPYPVTSYVSQEPRGYYAAPYAAPKIITIETVRDKRHKHHARYKRDYRHHSAHKFLHNTYGTYGKENVVTSYNTDYEANFVRVRVRKD